MCYYSGSRFVAQFIEGKVPFKRSLNDGVMRVLRELFEFLMSQDEDRVVSGHTITKKMVQRGQSRMQPCASVDLGGTLYQMVRARNGGSAALSAFLPWAASDNEIAGMEMMEEEADSEMV
jgi:hypothetical protein